MCNAAKRNIEKSVETKCVNLPWWKNVEYVYYTIYAIEKCLENFKCGNHLHKIQMTTSMLWILKFRMNNLLLKLGSNQIICVQYTFILFNHISLLFSIQLSIITFNMQIRIIDFLEFDVIHNQRTMNISELIIAIFLPLWTKQ